MVTYELNESARLGWDTILQKPARGIPNWLIHVMEHSQIERLAGAKPGDYKRDPEATYIAFQRAIGTCMLDQYIPDNPLTMGDQGFEGTEKGATTGAEEIVLDGLRISSPEAVVEHLEQVAFPQIQEAIATFDEAQRIKEILDYETAIQARLGPGILKVPYGVVSFPIFPYHLYGYGNYFAAYALYPEVMERHFSLQAELAVLRNHASARAYAEGGLPPLCRTDHDIADSRGTLMSLESLDRLWLPHFARSLEPVLRAGVRLIWHCDGNLMPMIPRLLEAGISGFQGFQYEDGMDYARICQMKDREGREMIIIGGVSVTRTLPMGTPDDVKREMRWLVEKGPRTGLFLGGSSSITPGVPWENTLTLVEGLRYYREHGRG